MILSQQYSAGLQHIDLASGGRGPSLNSTFLEAVTLYLFRLQKRECRRGRLVAAGDQEEIGQIQGGVLPAGSQAVDVDFFVFMKQSSR